jgi:2-polyprenyl-3-methyl-5-hydroxy-6-metoxy-1,4-benzoquinol methylase
MSELPTYYTNVNPALLAAIPSDATRILEIGCGAGALGAKYRATVNENCEYWGVEYVPEAAVHAQGALHKVITGSVEDEEIQKRLPKKHFDVLIFGDVLEHLREPWDVLKSLIQNMRPNGLCIACIPNIQHWSILRNLMVGNWKYEDSGLMDRTHLRFFTRKTMLDLFNGNGWKAVSQTPRIFAREKAVKPVEEILEARRRMGIDLKGDENDFMALQWVVTAKVQPQPEMSAVREEPGILVNTCIFAPNFLEVRTTLPANDLAKIPGVESVISRKEIDLNKVKHFPGPKIIIVQRPNVMDQAAWLGAVANVRMIDEFLIYEID